MTETEWQVWVAGEKPKTEHEWLNCTDPNPILTLLGYVLHPDVWPGFHIEASSMIDALRTRGSSERAMRLFGCACCHTVWQQIPDEKCRESVRVAEQFADRLVSEQELRRVHEEAKAVAKSLQGCSAWDAASAAAEASDQRQPFQPSISIGEWYAMTPFWGVVAAQTTRSYPSSEDKLLLLTQCNLLRDIIGNPFRPVAIERSWLTSDVRILAEGIYQDRAFDRMPILADALQDAGCDNDDILDHCRQPGEHVRGCWVIDLLTGRK